MTTLPTGQESDGPVRVFRRLPGREDLIVIWVILVAVAFNLINLYPEVAVDVTDLNDNAFHLLATEAAAATLTQGQDFTDPWVGTMAIGHPLFHYYQHLPHVSVALVHVLTLRIFPLDDLMSWSTYLLLSFFPLSIYWSMRRFGFDRVASAMGGLVAPLTVTNSLFGLEFGSYVSQGFGLYPQLWAMVLLPPALASGYRVITEGRGYFWAVLLLAATLVSHLLYGYMAFLSLGVLSLLQLSRPLNMRSIAEAIWRRWRRLIILFLLVVGVTSYFLVPFFLDQAYLNISVWENPARYDSYGYRPVLRGLAQGNLFDFGRLPSLTILVAAGLAICLVKWREERYRIPVIIFLLWLVLFFGRTTWGGLIDLLPLSQNILMHRFIAGVHLGGIFLMAVALATLWSWAISRPGAWHVLVAIAVTFLILAPVYRERQSYLEANKSGMKERQRAMAAEDEDLTALFEKLKKLPPGRVYAGTNHPYQEQWGHRYRVGPDQVFNILQSEGLDMLGARYHRYSLNSDLEMVFDENRWAQYNLYNVRYVVAPEGKEFPAFVRPIQQFGRHRLYQVKTTGYFDLVGSDLAFAGDRRDFFSAASSWLDSGLPGVKQHPTVLLHGKPDGFPNLISLSAAAETIPKIEVSTGPSGGQVLSEEVGSDFFVADVNVERDSLLLLKATYHPNWRATVDGAEADTAMLMPSFVGVPLTPGRHQVRLEYRPRRLRMVLLVLGLLTFHLIALGEKRGGVVSRWLALSAQILPAVPKLVKRRQRSQ